MHAQRMQQQLEAILERQAHCSTELLQCLESERQALTAHDTDALELITRDKTRHTQALDELDARREQMVTGLDCGSGAEGMQRCLEMFGSESHLADLWDRIIGNIRACRDNNIANGGILELGRLHVEQALAILRGSTAGPPAYDAQGEVRSSLGQRELGQV